MEIEAAKKEEEAKKKRDREQLRKMHEQLRQKKYKDIMKQNNSIDVTHSYRDE